MRKYLLLVSALGCSQPMWAQQPAAPSAATASTATEFPLNEGKLYYEGVVEVNPASKKGDLYRMGRTWFVDTYVDSKEVLQLDDKTDGRMIGKGTYKYSFLNGINISNVVLHFTLLLDVKDGKYRYRMYDFRGDNVNTGLLSDPELRVLDYDKCYTDYKAGKRIKYNLKVLQGMDAQVKGIAASLEKVMTKTIKKDDF